MSSLSIYPTTRDIDHDSFDRLWGERINEGKRWVSKKGKRIKEVTDIKRREYILDKNPDKNISDWLGNQIKEGGGGVKSADGNWSRTVGRSFLSFLFVVSRLRQHFWKMHEEPGEKSIVWTVGVYVCRCCMGSSELEEHTGRNNENERNGTHYGRDSRPPTAPAPILSTSRLHYHPWWCVWARC